MATDGQENPRLTDNPLPEEHAEYVIRRLEKFIRDGRTLDEGMSFRKWQLMAKTEIALSINETRNNYKYIEVNDRRVLFVLSSAITTIGFWGTAIGLEQSTYLPGATICLISGLSLLFLASKGRYKRYKDYKAGMQRRGSLSKIKNLNNRVKRLEQDLEKEQKKLEKSINELKTPQAVSLYERFITS